MNAVHVQEKMFILVLSTEKEIHWFTCKTNTDHFFFIIFSDHLGSIQLSFVFFSHNAATICLQRFIKFIHIGFQEEAL